jgi:cytoskeletal protein RodZ
VGLDAERTLREFAELVPPATSAVVPLTPTNVEDNERVESERRMASALVRLLAVSVPIAGVVLYFASAGLPGDDPAAEADARSSAGLVEAPPPAATAGPDAARVPAPAPVDQAVEPTPVASAAGRLVVTLEAVAPCWVSSTVDGERTVARLLQPGERRTIEVGKELVLTAGDAAALRLTLNGAAARPLGSPGEVVTRRITPANFTDYLPR